MASVTFFHLQGGRPCSQTQWGSIQQLSHSADQNLVPGPLGAAGMLGHVVASRATVPSYP